jgi:hypothetical protein
MLVTVISRGHSGTRVLAHTLIESGFYMGSRINKSGDFTPGGKPIYFYKACETLGRFVKYSGDYKWDFTEVNKNFPNQVFIKYVNNYLRDILQNDSEHKGWKLPETLLGYPWVVKMFPDVYYIYMIRDPVDCIMGEHLTDNLSFFGINECDVDQGSRIVWSDIGMKVIGESTIEQRIFSWKYQYQIYKNTPKPKNIIEIRFEDFILNQDSVLKRLEKFLNCPLSKIKVNSEPANRSLRTMDKNELEKYDRYFREELKRYGYR